MRLTEEQIRALVRDERAKILAEEQAVCPHGFGNLHSDLITITCQSCSKTLTRDDWGLGHPQTRVFHEAVAELESA